ncbi:MAG: hypothetical protein K2X29_13510, partial [Candidatus Obscuribacterales bacterium]|nr:hypothetical protein [Candidatus Obscuribacterales bacterium]
NDSQLKPLFGTAGNAKLFKIDAVEVITIGGKKAISMIGASTENGHWSKNIYISLTGDWTTNL